MALNFDSLVRALQTALNVPGLPARMAIQIREFFSLLSQYGGNPTLDVIVVDAAAGSTGNAVVGAESFRLFGYLTFAIDGVAGAGVGSELVDTAGPSTLVQAYGDVNPQGQFELAQFSNTGNWYSAADGPFTLANEGPTAVRVIFIVGRG